MPLFAGGQPIARLYRGATPIARAYRGETLLFDAAPTFSPLDLAGLELWLDAADTATITDAGGGAVSQWNDKSGNGRNFAQATSGDRPVTGASTLNGRNVIDFDADFLVSSSAASVWKFLHDASGSTVFIVFHVDAVSRFMEWFGTQDGSTQVGYYLTARPDSGNNMQHNIARGVSGNQAVSNNSGGGFFTPGTWLILALAVDPANATAANRSAFIKNGGTPVKNNALTNAPSSANPTLTLGIGKIANNDRKLSGSIAEILVYSGVLSGSDREAVEDYLSGKWNIALA